MSIPIHKSLRGAAVAFLLATAPDTQAVYLNGDGIGQALIYPYYTVQSADGNPFNTFLSVVNTSAVDAKALRVRFREARNGAPVLSFNLFLAPYDVWTGAVVTFATGTRLLSTDLSCTDPPFAIEFAPGSLPFMDLASAAYAGDGAGDGIERTREGFVEILEMATLLGSSMAAASPATPDGVPSNCAALRGPLPVINAAPSGGLSGTLTLINVASGMDFTVRADALAELATRPYHRAASDPYPDFSSAEIDAVSTVWSEGVTYRSLWNRPIDAVSAALMRSRWLSEYILDTASRSRTDVVLTFPTRHFYATSTGATAPFTKPAAWRADCAFEASERVDKEYYDRSSRPSPPCNCDFILPPPPPPLTFCATSTALTINNGTPHMPAAGVSGVLGSLSTRTLSVTTAYQNGWLEISPQPGASMTSLAASTRLNSATGLQSAGAHSFSGLPVVGFTVRTFRNDTLQCPAAGVCQGNYGGAYPLRFQRAVSPPAS